MILISAYAPSEKFVCDAMVGTLARWLRAIGYDTIYLKDTSDRDVVAHALKDNRTILTRDHHFERMKSVRYLVMIQSTKLADQFQQVVETLHLDTKKNLFTRCMECNHLLIKVERESVNDLVPPYVFKTSTEFSQCTNCGRIYWAGTHLSQIRDKIQKMLSHSNSFKP
jgi:uncharacterized protein